MKRSIAIIFVLSVCSMPALGQQYGGRSATSADAISYPDGSPAKVQKVSHAGATELTNLYEASMSAPGCGCGCDVSCGSGCDAACGCGSTCGSLFTQQSMACKDYWVSFEAMAWWLEGDVAPPLVTTSPVGTNRDESGQLGEPGTTILLGNERLDTDARFGGRVKFGQWLDCQHEWAVEGHFFWVGNHSANYNFTGDGTTGSLARPFFNADVNNTGQDADVIAFFDGANYQQTGLISVHATSEVYSAGAVLRRCLLGGPKAQIDGIAGYRFFKLNEGLNIDSFTVFNSTAGGQPAVQPGTTVSIFDNFDTFNEFHGADLGLKGEFYRGRFGVELLTKCALGSMNQTVRIGGGNTVTVPGPPFQSASGPQGLFAEPTNAGTYDRNRFCVIPELNLTMYYQLSSCVRASLGYSVLYVSNVVRPSDQIDFAVDGQVAIGNPATTNPARPMFNFVEDDIWLQAISAGLEVRF